MLSPKTPTVAGIRGVGGFDGAVARLVLGEQHVLLRVELVDALHRADIDAGSVLHVDAGFGDDRETGHGSVPHARRWYGRCPRATLGVGGGYESLELGGCGLHPVVESFLLGGIADVEVVDALQHAHRAVDQLADDVGVAGMTLRVSSDVHQDMVQRDRRVSPPPHLADCIQRKFA